MPAGEASRLLVGSAGLAVVWAAHLLAARAALHQAGERRPGIVGAFGLALAMAGPSLIGRAVPNLLVANGLSSLAALALVVLLWRRRPERSPPPAARSSIPVGARLLHVALLALVVDACLEGYWWDEHSGHFGLTSVIAHGILPPEFPLYPGEPFRYHYGFDVLSGTVRAFTGLGSGAAIDVVSILSFLLLMTVAADAGRRLAGPRGAALAPLLVPLGSGTLQFLLAPDLGAIELRATWLPARFGEQMPPTVISNFFQHPQGLGMSLGLAVVLLFDAGPARRARVVLGAVLLGLCSLAHIVFFGVIGIALGAQAILRSAPSRASCSTLVFELTALIGALALAFVQGGFLAATSTPFERVLTLGQGHFPGDPSEVLMRHLVTFGLPLIALPWILGRIIRRPDAVRVALAASALLGFVLPAFIRYERSWDMVKLYGVAAFFANVLLVEPLAAGFGAGRGRRWVAGLLTGLACVSGLHFLVRMGPLDGRLGVPAMHFPGPSRVAEQAGDWLARAMHRPREAVLVPYWLDGVSAGVLAPGHDWRVLGSSWMLDRDVLDRRRTHFRLARAHLRPVDLDALGVAWALLSPWDLRGLSRTGKANLAREFDKVAEIAEGYDVRYLYRRRLPGAVPSGHGGGAKGFGPLEARPSSGSSP